MTRLYLDTEFDGHGGRLLSIALVSDCGREFYAEVAGADPSDPWVRLNVVSKFTGPMLDRKKVRDDLRTFLARFSRITVVADWYADFVHFFGLFEGEDFRSSFDVSVHTVLLSGPSDIRPENPHNALSDARALRDYWEARAA
jgi:hypothetical protein